MENEKEIEKQELINKISNRIWQQIGLPHDSCDAVATMLVNQYTIKEKHAFIASYKIYRTIYASNYDEASEIFDAMTLEDMGDDGEWELEPV